ncbi:MAG: NAD(P) transhydrogenase subunit alpha [Spirochaetales bacterium]|nr:NAD(P) transhydrogenase subunit alpha [Spirochaetales bacterium]
MVIAAVREMNDERSVLSPEAVKKLVAVEGFDVVVESGISSHWNDEEFQRSGASIETDRISLMSKADVLVRIHPSTPEELAGMKPGSLHLSLLDPYNNRSLVESFAGAKVDAISLEMIPRTTLAQKMDVLSSQASLAGYVAVIKAAERLNRILPMMMTPAGTLSPARVFVIGAGVAGLQAIATAKRLGARVEAFDTRPVVEEQVQSLGAKFLKVDLGETGQTAQGYAKALTEEQLAKQREAMAKAVAAADVVITTAKLFGRPAPRIVTSEMIEQMKNGSVVVDLAAGSGGNVEGTQVDEEVMIHGVRLIGIDNLPGEVAVHASQMLGANISALLLHMWDSEKNTLKLDASHSEAGEDLDEIVKGCLVVKGGSVVHSGIQSHYASNTSVL